MAECFLAMPNMRSTSSSFKSNSGIFQSMTSPVSW